MTPLDLAEQALNGDVKDAGRQLVALSDRPDALAAGAFVHVLARDFEAASSMADVLGEDPVAHTVRGFVRSVCLAEPGDPPSRSSASAVRRGMLAFVEQEWAMSAGRVDLAEALARANLSAAPTPTRAAWAGQALIRALCFQGRIGEAQDVVAGLASSMSGASDRPSPRAHGLLSAAAVFAVAQAGNVTAVRAHADRLDQAPAPEHYLAAGEMVLTSFALSAIDELERAARLMDRAGGPNMRWLQLVDRVYGHEILLQAELARGDLVAAAGRLDQVDALAIDDHDLATAAAARCRARFAEATSDGAAAVAAAAIASERAARVRGRLEVLRADVLAAGAGVDAQRAADQFNAVADQAVQTGATAIRDWAVRELRRMGLRLRDVPTDAWDTLTPQQAMVARLAAAGLRNREIAEQLFVSERTVEGHIRSILSALAAPTRVAIGEHLPNDLRGAPPANLTPRQRDVGRLIAEGRSNREIAQVLGVGDKTVEKHVADLFARLGVRSRSGVAAALRARGTGAQ
jgi:DNA-binding NarL/FixJ family response regulator